MADPIWMRKALVLSLALAVPAAVLVSSAWRSRLKNQRPASWRDAAAWVCVFTLATYLVWLINVAFELSVLLMVAWPLLAILLSLLGCGAALGAEKRDRAKLAIANGLTLALACASLVKPN